ncbi:MAG: hypothetical protein ABF624_00220 [Liquorilactobacillus ghanensis]|uniref:hypothetical protein n=1 Tax=Liquorilactobacillus ghanensis TaxID=399370 RepID=UPI0039E91350
MEKLYVYVDQTVEGITGNTLDMEVEENDAENVDRLSALLDDAVMSETDYDRLTDIWNEHSTITDILDALEKAELIESYEIKEEED